MGTGLGGHKVQFPKKDSQGTLLPILGYFLMASKKRIAKILWEEVLKFFT
jgi:hypothetical protein